MVKAHYTADELRFRARIGTADLGLVNRVTAADAGWEHLSMESRRAARGETHTFATEDAEAVLVVLGGTLSARSNRGTWEGLGARAHVFAGMPTALFLPPRTEVELRVASDRAEWAMASAKAEAEHPARLVRPEDVAIELRGGHHNSRQINQIVPPGFPASRLVCVEVYTPAGNWSSYPPHKHDTHRTDDDGRLVEGDLEEFYCYKFARPGAWALQRIYTEDRSTDATVTAEDGDVVLVPFGYHPVSAAYGYDCYYLNFLAGSAQTLAATDDPAHAWVKETWTALDARVPMVTHAAK